MVAVDLNDLIERCEIVLKHGMIGTGGNHPISVEHLLKTLKELPTVEVDEWTSCKEKLPDTAGYYLVTNLKGKVRIKWFEPMYGWLGWENMLAWKPLPEAYDEK